MTRIVVCGIGGRMGQTLVRLSRDQEDIEIVAGIDRHVASGEAAKALGVERVVAMEEAGSVIARADVVLDFSSPQATHALVTTHANALEDRAIAVGTTGLDPETLQTLDRLALESAVLVAANFSVGVNLMIGLVEQAARVLGAEAYDAEVVETHHGRKVDAPSGTALSLAAAIARGRDVELNSVRRDGRSGETGERPVGEIGIHALRGGAVAGEHRVHFLGMRERLEIAHHAEDRALFAEGALVAARWLTGRSPGRYSMRDVLGL
ncbi:MAG: 4-hydroxy-tetrahydrodipicolinate reductase [Candidatus Cloacimonetes bacterium]|jgi:4-hydroxy-tetrahydrodipicolinate reductase|nr:4-hydroxy-tetrahydrodipicolinate reductase [Candidatus Cloacimonadota bacterium]